MKVQAELEPRDKDLQQESALNVAARWALVINDESAMRVLIHDVLVSAGMGSVILSGSVEANVHIRERKFDMIVIGLSGPSGEGIELVREIRKFGFNQRTPIIAISDDQSPRALPRGFEAGASFFVYTPIDKAHLIRLICVAQGTIEQEKRRFRRIPLRFKVRVRSGGKELVGESIDISLNGTLVNVPEAFPVGSPVEVSLYLFNRSDPIVGRGSVVRVPSHNQMGILLNDLSAAESARLQEFLLPRIAE